MQLTRGLGTALAVAGLAVTMTAMPAEAADDLTGTWNVVAKPGAINTCGDAAENSAYQWILTQNGTSLAVVVQGKTSFPQLTGTISGKRVMLEGASAAPLGSGFAGVYATSAFQLDVGGKSLKGKRFFLGSRPRPGGGTVLCMTEFEVSGSKQ